MKSAPQPSPPPPAGSSAATIARDTAALGETRGASITVNWVGDIVLGSRHGLPPDNARGVFAGVASLLRRADLTLGNLEGTFGTGGTSKCAGTASPQCFAFQAPPGNAAALEDAGFDVMNLANNHALDFGEPGQRQTITALDRVHVRHAGRPGAVTRLTRRGMRIAVIGFAPYRWATSLTDIPAARTLVTRASRDADLVVVVMHAGAEGAGHARTPNGPERQFGEDRGYVRGFAHAVIDGGADLVLGSGPHVVRGMEIHRRRLIAYSLGNFVGYHNFALGSTLALSGILRVSLGPTGRLRSGRWISVRLEGPGIPRLDRTHAAARFVADLSRRDFGADAVAIRDDGTFSWRRRR